MQRRASVTTALPKPTIVPRAVTESIREQLRARMAQCAHTYVRDMAFAYSLTKRAPSGRSVASRLLGLSTNGADVNHVVGELAQYRHAAGVSIRGQASVVWDASLPCVIVAMNSFIRQGLGTTVDFFKHVGVRTLCDKTRDWSSLLNARVLWSDPLKLS